MTHETILVREEDGIARVALNRPEKRNALSARMMDELTEFAGTAGARARAVILTGEGDAFCAGGDLLWMREQAGAGRATRVAEARRLAGTLRALNEMPAPLVAAIHGGAFGGGVGLACVADVAVAAEGARFGLTETRLGLIPATIGPYVVARLGEGGARRIFMSSRVFGTDEAVALGIVARAVPPGELGAAAEAEAAPYLDAAPGAVAAAKALARSLGPRIDEEVIEETIGRLADRWESPEAAEGIDAFLEGRPAAWARGR